MDIIEHPVHIEYNFSDNSMPSNDTCLQTKDVKKKHVKFEYPILGRMRCKVNLKRLNLARHHHKLFKLKRCDISVSSSFCSEYIRNYNAKHISEILSKLINESMLREKMLEYAKIKQKKTRTNLFFYSAEETRKPETPQEFFLQNFHLKPKYLLHKNESPDDEIDSLKKSRISSSCTKSSDMQPSRMTSTVDEVSQSILSHNVFNASTKDIEAKREPKEYHEEESLVPVRAKRMFFFDSKQPLCSPNHSFVKSSEVKIKKLSVKGDYNRSQDLVECSDVKVGNLWGHRRHVNEVREFAGSNALTHNFCHPCRLPFSTELSFRRHESICHKKEKLMDLETILKNQCSECSKEFQSPASLKRHIRTSHQGHQTECPQCGLWVSRLDNHMATVHQVVTASCPYCSVILVPAHLPRHVRSVHLGHRQRCVLCDRFMSNIHKHQRSVHMVTHTDHSNCDCKLFLGPCMTISTRKEMSL